MWSVTCPRWAGRPAPASSRRVAVVPRRTLSVQAAASDARAESEEERKERFKKTFSGQKSYEGAAALLANVPTPLLFAASAALAGAAGYAGYTAGLRAPAQAPQPATAVGAAVIGVGAAAVAATRAKAARDTGAGVDLWNALVDSDDPTHLSGDVVTGISSKYGVNLNESQPVEVKQAYAAYLQSLIPPGDKPLRGDEAALLGEFLKNLGLPDEAAAECHMDVARSFHRMRMEYQRGDATAEGTRPFQKVIYVSTLLFGETKAQFLLPWARRFDGVTPEQVAIAKRDCARAIMRGRIDTDFGGKIPATLTGIQSLRSVQTSVGLSDEACAALVKDVVAADVDASLQRAVGVIRQRGASVDIAPAVAALDGLLQLSKQYQEFAAAGDLVVPGLGPITTAGTSYAADNKKNDLLDLYKLYLTTKMRQAGDALTPQLADALAALTQLLGLPAARADGVRLQAVMDTYQKLLTGAVRSGALDNAPSPATVLNQMLTQVSMPGEQAAALHDNLYRQKLEECVRDGKIDDNEAAALERTSRLLCIPAARVAAIDSEVKGRMLRDAVQSAMDAGIDSFGKYELDKVVAVKEDLRLDDELAFQVLQELGRRMLTRMINGARLKQSKLENARELKQVVYFSNVILAPLVRAFKKAPKSESESKDAAMKEIADILAQTKAAEAAEAAGAGEEGASEAVEGARDAAEGSQAGDEAERASTSADEVAGVQPTSLAKAEKAASDRAGGETVTTDSGKQLTMSSQKDITVASDFDRRERVDIYKTYLMFCMTGDVVQLPMGGTIVMERDETEFARLSQLGDILGLSQFDVYEVHTGMAEQAFKAQAEDIIGGSATVNPEARTRLDELSKQMGLPEETAKKVVRGITNRRLAGNLSAMKAQGLLTLSKVLELKGMDVDLSSVLSENDLLQLYREEIERQVASGQGAIDATRMLEHLPAELGVDAQKARTIGQDIGKSKARNILVQAVAYYRQKKQADAMKYLKNFLACARLAGGDIKGAGKWDAKPELLDMYGEFCLVTEQEELQREMAAVLELEEAQAAGVRDAVKAGTFGKATSRGVTETSSSIF